MSKEIDHESGTQHHSKYPKLIHFNKLPKGGHFAAWEEPKLFSEEVRTGFISLR
jgi:pimeloyl-ACP methyl ester carboxylesterase